MRISGSGRLSEGKINDEIILSGSARLEGNFECTRFKSSGSLRGNGNLTVHGDVKNSGSFRLNGHLRGDGNARFSGSTSVAGAILIKGHLGNSGSLRTGNKVEGLEGIRFSGSSKIQGDLLSQNDIVIEGSTTINGNISGDAILIGVRLLRERKMLKQPFKVYGNINAKNRVDLTGTFVEGDVKGRDVKIDKGTEVKGTVYYVDNIEVDQKTKLNNEPIQINAEELQGFNLK